MYFYNYNLRVWGEISAAVAVMLQALLLLVTVVVVVVVATGIVLRLSGYIAFLLS